MKKLTGAAVYMSVLMDLKVIFSFLLLMVLGMNGYAGGAEIGNEALTGLLVKKGVLSKEEAVSLRVKKEGRLRLGALSYINLTGHKVKDRIGGSESTAEDGRGVSVDRFYFQALYDMDKVWLGRVTFDVNNEQDRVDLKRKMNVFLKYAYIEGRFRPEFKVRLGVMGTPWIAYEEALWRHRYVTNVYTDFYGFDDSADYGIAVTGRLLEGFLDYYITETNGGGYSAPKATRAIDLNTRITIHPVKGLDISGEFRDGYRGTKATGATNPAKDKLYQGLVSFGIDRSWRFGVGLVRNDKDEKGTGTKTRESGLNLWGWVRLSDSPFGGFARYDYKKKDPSNSSVNEETNRYILGADYVYSKNLRFSLVYDYIKKDNYNNNSGDARKDEKYGLYSRFAF